MLVKSDLCTNFESGSVLGIAILKPFDSCLPLQYTRGRTVFYLLTCLASAQKHTLQGKITRARDAISEKFKSLKIISNAYDFL